jgi:hypothetical protein
MELEAYTDLDDKEWLAALSSLFPEWLTPEDCAAYDNLE